MISILSLFSGIGAFESALDRIGCHYQLTGYCEIDPYASKSYAQIHGVSESLNLHDVTTIDTALISLLGGADIITYGFPCQDISCAGKQRGFTDENGNRTRSGLFFEALRIIKDLQPKYAIAENVKALTSKKFENEFKTVLDSLDGAGYNNYWAVLNAKDYGIPQNRERVFIVSIRKDIDKGGFKFPEKMPLNIRVKDILENNVDEKYYINTEKARQLIKKLLDKNRITGVEVCDATVNAPNVRDISNAIISRYDAGISNQRSWGTAVIEPPVICASRGRNADNPSDRTTGISTEQRLELKNDGTSNTLTTVSKDDLLLEPAPRILQVGNLISDADRKFTNPQTGRVYDPDGLAPTLNTMQGGEREPKIIEPHANKIVRTGTIGKHETDEVLSVCGISKTLKATDYKNPVKIMVSEPKIKIVGRMDGYEQTGRVYGPSGIACTLQSRDYKDPMRILEEPAPKGGQREVKILETAQEAYRIRKLTPRECFRLMGFTDAEFDSIKGVSNTQLYKQAGNSIVVNVLEAIFNRLLTEEEKA